ncbi:hypothetical protein [uncultured Umboniibacter sp.]|uniref:hypothetical protein n=1 Tax=uncultured Umboniibacter sp. TaxID=1798917 RepID=UPI002616B20E|nr:hypothetical protein [uncultured Umboniibacter sp.]
MSSLNLLLSAMSDRNAESFSIEVQQQLVKRVIIDSPNQSTTVSINRLSSGEQSAIHSLLTKSVNATKRDSFFIDIHVRSGALVLH